MTVPSLKGAPARKVVIPALPMQAMVTAGGSSAQPESVRVVLWVMDPSSSTNDNEQDEDEEANSVVVQVLFVCGSPYSAPLSP